MVRNENINKYFLGECEKLFKFLRNDYSFIKREIFEGKFGVTIIFLSDKVGVSIALNLREGKIFVDLIRLINNKIPELPIFIRDDTVLNEHDLLNLLQLRNPEFKINWPSWHELVSLPGKEEKISQVLRIYAENLFKYASDVLKGDFTVFQSLDKIVKERVKNQG